ncbi:HAD family hydrolase [Haladaptatus pallidirubidus]|uniref:HAD family hydrolase n=1 Tax=Haladaptatus pallidirubidus TaxID=1008152 RepID=A0AAV3UG70_9EURY|nr:HAD family phosphatase [Haladaptatus pallidirubidus]
MDGTKPNGETPNAVLFDMDGVIVNSEDFWVELEEETIFPEVVEEDVTADEITGMNYREIYDYLDSEYQTTATKEEFVAIYDEAAKQLYGEHVSLMDGFHDLLADLRTDGIEIALVSSSPHHWIDIVLDRFDLDFEEVVSAEDIDAPGKPEPAIFEHAAGLLGKHADECAAVEDSENGVESAVRAGTYCIGYPNGAKELDLSAADVVVSSPAKLREELLN